MAVVNTESATITREVGRRPSTNAGTTACALFIIFGTVEVAAGDDDTSTYRLFKVPSRARVVDMRISCDAITNGTSYDLGLYTSGSGAVVDADIYAAALDLSSAINSGAINSGFKTRDISKMGQRVWEDAGLSDDSGLDYDIVLTANTVGSAAGTISGYCIYGMD